MNAVQRRMEIYQILQRQKTAEVNDLAQRFGVSKMTIRRDLSIFEKQGLVTTNYGGAYLNSGNSVDPSFSLKSGQRQDVKQYIASEVAHWINDGDTIGLDCGTTTLQVLKYIQSKRVTVVTNSWHAVSFLQGSSRMRLILAPGEYREQSAGVISNMTADFFRSFYYDWSLIGTQGFSGDFGASVADADEAVVKNALLQNANHKVLLADHSKIGRRFLARHAMPDDFDRIVTDYEVSKEQLDGLHSCDGRVYVAAQPVSDGEEQE